MLDQNGIYISKKQASITAAVLVLLCLLIFIAGYFWGKRSIIDGFSQKASQESFNDQVDYLLTMQSFTAKHGPLPEQTEITVTDNDDAQADMESLLQGMPDALEELGGKTEVPVKPAVSDVAVVVAKKQTDPVAKKSVDIKRYAAIAGFAKKASAVGMINRLKNYNIHLELKTKVSKSGSGKGTKTWYQVITPKMNEDELQLLVDKVVSIEHIKRKDVKVY